MGVQIRHYPKLVIFILLLGLAIASGCGQAVTADSPSRVDRDAIVQAPTSVQTFNNDSLSTAVAAAISETAAAQQVQNTFHAEPTETPEPTVAVHPVVISTVTASPLLVHAPTNLSEPTAVPPTPTLVPSPPTVPPTATPAPTVPPTATPAPTELPVPTAIPTATPAQLSVDELAEAFSSAVVQVSSSAGVGTGVIFRLVGTKALVLTNQHLIGSASSVTVRVNDSNDYTGTIVSTDISRDLAVVRICCSIDYLALDFASPDDVVRGESVAALGYPLGFNSLRVSQGVVSGIEFDPGTNRDVIQTDAAIDLGDSGGPLLLMTGQIAGISSREMIATNSGIPTDGLGFAISVSTISEVIDAMVSGLNVSTSAPVPHPETIDGKYTSPNYKYEITVPDGWILDTSLPRAVNMWDEFSGTTILVRRSGDPYGYVDTANWHQYWTYVGQPWQESVKNVDESYIFRTYAGNTSDSLQGLEFRNTFELDGELYRDFTHVFYEKGILWYVSIFISNQVWVQPEYAEYRLKIMAAVISFHPPFTE